MDSGSDSSDFFVPKGKYSVNAHYIDRDDDKDLPDYVLAFDPDVTKPPRRKVIPYCPADQE